MRVTEEEVAALRGLLSGDDQDDWSSRSRDLLQSGHGQGYDRLAYATFAILVRRRFPPGWTNAEVVRFVADLRSTLAEAHETIDPLAAEGLIRRALGDQTAPTTSNEMRGYALLILLIALTEGEQLDESGLETLLSDARMLADRSFSESTPQ